MQNINAAHTNGLIVTEITGHNTGSGCSSGVTVSRRCTVVHKHEMGEFMKKIQMLHSFCPFLLLMVYLILIKCM